MTAAWTAYRMLAPVLGALAPVARPFVPAAERHLWNERLGRVSHQGGCHAWVHAASLGEAGAVRALLPEVERASPGARLHLSATTFTGRTRLAALGHPVSLAPLDFPAAARRFFDGVRPQRLILVETELWPHWLLTAAHHGVPVAVVSAKLSARSLERLRRLGHRMRELVAGLGMVLAQTENDRARWIELGADPEHTEVIGNLKSDALPRPSGSRPEMRIRAGLDPDRLVLVLGSVRPGEVRLLVRAWQALPESLRAAWQVVAVPRHAGVADQLRREAASAGVANAARADQTPAAACWRWDARPGVLNDYYAAADVAFVGASLVPIGGHNPLEPAAYGAAVVMGDNTHAQADAVARLRQAHAIVIVDGEAELREALRSQLEDEAERVRCGTAARGVVDGMRGVARRAVERLVARGLWPPS